MEEERVEEIMQNIIEDGNLCICREALRQFERKTEIIKLWDNEKYEYPMIEIDEGSFEEFEKDLKEYQKNEDYNFDDFLELVEKKDYFVRAICFEKEVFF